MRDEGAIWGGHSAGIPEPCFQGQSLKVAMSAMGCALGCRQRGSRVYKWTMISLSHKQRPAFNCVFTSLILTRYSDAGEQSGNICSPLPAMTSGQQQTGVGWAVGPVEGREAQGGTPAQCHRWTQPGRLTWPLCCLGRECSITREGFTVSNI